MVAILADKILRCIKIWLYIINIPFLLVGFFTLLTGTHIYNVFDELYYFLLPRSALDNVLVMAGAVIFCTTLFGYYAASKESSFMLFAFSGAFSLIVVFEAAVVAVVHALQAGLIGFIIYNIKVAMTAYEVDPLARNAVDSLQLRLHCCGYAKPADWQTTSNAFTNGFYPESCCSWYNLDVNEKGHRYCIKPHESGCGEGYSQIIYDRQSELYNIAKIIVLIQLTIIACACALGYIIKQQKTDPAKTLREITNNLVNGYHPVGQDVSSKTTPIVVIQPDYPVKTLIDC